MPIGDVITFGIGTPSGVTPLLLVGLAIGTLVGVPVVPDVVICVRPDVEVIQVRPDVETIRVRPDVGTVEIG